MTKEIKQHILFTIEMLNPLGVISLFFGILALILGQALISVALIFYSFLLYEINWHFDDLKDDINKLIERRIK